MSPSGSSQNKDDANGLSSTNSIDQVQSLKVQQDESRPSPDKYPPNGQAASDTKNHISPDHLPTHLEAKATSEEQAGEL